MAKLSRWKSNKIEEEINDDLSSSKIEQPAICEGEGKEYKIKADT